MDYDYRKENVAVKMRDEDGNPIWVRNRNTLLDSRVYTVEFDEGTHREYAANMTAKNMYAQVDDEGKEHLILRNIIDNQIYDYEIKKEYGFITVE